MFQAKRDAIVADEKHLSEMNAQKIAAAQAAYIRKQEAVKAKVEEQRQQAGKSRSLLVENRKKDADEMRDLLARETARKEEMLQEAERQTRDKRDEIYSWSKTSSVGP